jgi:hypothetical protein
LLLLAGDEDEEEGEEGDEGPAVGGGCEEEGFVFDAAGAVPL